MELKRPGTIALHLLIMVGYSILFFVLNTTVGGDSVIPLHWGVLLLHSAVLFIWGLVNLFSNRPQPNGGQLLLAALLVALIGHGLCFMNGLVNFNVH